MSQDPRDRAWEGLQSERDDSWEPCSNCGYDMNDAEAHEWMDDGMRAICLLLEPDEEAWLGKR
jgi:hypothetical protein